MCKKLVLELKIWYEYSLCDPKFEYVKIFQQRFLKVLEVKRKEYSLYDLELTHLNIFH